MTKCKECLKKELRIEELEMIIDDLNDELHDLESKIDDLNDEIASLKEE